MGDGAKTGQSAGSDSAFLVELSVELQGASGLARKEFERAIKDYAHKLSNESALEELSSREPGVMVAEITASSLIRAEKNLLRKIADDSGGAGRRVVGKLEGSALAGVPIFSSATGVMGSYLSSGGWLQWSVFSLLAMSAAVCIAYLAKRRLL